jgi:hypothetical protein
MSGEDERDPSKATAEPATAADPAADPRRIILARRASFIAAAMVGIACGKTTTTNEPPPMPCLSVAWVPPEAGAPAQGDADATSSPAVVGGADAAVSDRDASDAGATDPADGGRRGVRPPQPVPVRSPAPCLSAPMPPQRLPSKR